MGATVVVQARMTSRRLPGKVMMEVASRPLLALLLTRLRHARRVGTIVLATTRLTSDDPLAALANMPLKLSCVAHGLIAVEKPSGVSTE